VQSVDARRRGHRAVHALPRQQDSLSHRATRMGCSASTSRTRARSRSHRDARYGIEPAPAEAPHPARGRLPAPRGGHRRTYAIVQRRLLCWFFSPCAGGATGQRLKFAQTPRYFPRSNTLDVRGIGKKLPP
jgi:hypothetical protein